jgi:hypothetical protein
MEASTFVFLRDSACAGSRFEPLVAHRTLQWFVRSGVIGTGKLVRESHPPHFLMNPGVSLKNLGEILSFGLWMRKQGYRESTIQPCVCFEGF